MTDNGKGYLQALKVNARSFSVVHLLLPELLTSSKVSNDGLLLDIAGEFSLREPNQASLFMFLRIVGICPLTFSP